MTAKRFEDLDIWKLSRELVKSIYSITAKTRFPKDYGFTNQIQRSSVSIKEVLYL